MALTFVASAVENVMAGIKAAGGQIENVNFDNIEVRDWLNVGFEEREIILVDASKKAIRNIQGRSIPLLLAVSTTGMLKELYLSMFTRSIAVVDEAEPHAPIIVNGMQMRETAKGSAVDLYKSKSVATESVNLLDGKHIMVVGRKSVATMRPTNNGLRVFGHQTKYNFWLCNEDGSKIYKADGKTELTAEELKHIAD